MTKKIDPEKNNINRIYSHVLLVHKFTLNTID